MTATSFAEIADAKYILLTTFTKSGTPKPTAIWAAPDGDRLLVMTEEDSWKVKRIRNTPRVTLRILDKSEAPAVIRAVNRRYGILGWGFGVYMKVRGLDKTSVGVELKAA